MGKRFFKAPTWVQDPEFSDRGAKEIPTTAADWTSVLAVGREGGKEDEEEEGLHDAPPSSARLSHTFRVPSRMGGNRGITMHSVKPPPRKT